VWIKKYRAILMDGGKKHRFNQPLLVATTAAPGLLPVSVASGHGDPPARCVILAAY